jgi:hypothetical protein
MSAFGGGRTGRGLWHVFDWCMHMLVYAYWCMHVQGGSVSGRRPVDWPNCAPPPALAQQTQTFCKRFRPSTIRRENGLFPG